MRWIATLTLFFVLTGGAWAAGSDEQYLDIYNEILQGETLQASGQSPAAALKFLQAQTDLQKLHTDHPDWNPDIVKYRLDYLTDKLQTLAKFLPATNAPAPGALEAVQPATNAPVPGQETTIASLQQQNAGFQEQIRSLTSVNAELENKLHEALSVQPAVNPDELAKAKEKIAALQKERDVLAVALDQEKANTASAVEKARAEGAKEASAAAEAKLAEANKELETLKAAQAAQQQENAELKQRTADEEKQTQDEVARLKEAAGESDKILAAATKELELLKAGGPPTIAPQPGEAAKQAPEEADQLKQAMATISADETQIATLRDQVAQAEKKYASANDEIAALKSAPQTGAQSTQMAISDNTKELTQERDKLKDDLAARSKELADAEARHSEEVLTLRAALQDTQKQRDELQKKLDAVSGQVPKAPVAEPPPSSPPATTPPPASNPPSASAEPDPAMAAKLEQLQARNAVLEADPVPYTAEELAVLKLPPASAQPEPPKPLPVVHPRHLHSAKDLPPGSDTLWSDALQATKEHNFDAAEQKFNAVLKQDPTNVYVLAYLANAQFAAGHLDDCEKSVERALAVEPDDPGSLYLLGVLRYRQERLDEALDALSRSAEYNPTNSATQNFLGCVLADKGLRPAAETALRKALQADPDYAEAHFNLAVVYVGNQPPSLELARWHYKKALALGHPKSDMLEKLLYPTP